MQILVVNDDGPISISSPYIYPFITALQAAGHQTSVVLPDIPRSWIGKAHIVGSTLECSYYTPAPGDNEWVLVTGTPASCTQLGLYHLFKDRPSPDLVISGPNFGRNATTIYNLSSGTVGGALEAALCQKRAIALSFASKDKQPPTVIAAAVRHSIKLIENLYDNWPNEVELYNINVPMIPDVEENDIFYTQALRSSWSSGCLYQEWSINGQSNGFSHDDTVMNGSGSKGSRDNPATKRHINELSRDGQVSTRCINGVSQDHHVTNGDTIDPVKDAQELVLAENKLGSNPTRTQFRFFKWAPQLSDIARLVEKSPPGTDAWAIKNGFTSVTPLTANFAQVHGYSGNINLRNGVGKA